MKMKNMKMYKIIIFYKIDDDSYMILKNKKRKMGKDYRNLYYGLAILFGLPCTIMCCLLLKMCFPKLIVNTCRLLDNLLIHLYMFIKESINDLIRSCNKLDDYISERIYPEVKELNRENNNEIV